MQLHPVLFVFLMHLHTKWSTRRYNTITCRLSLNPFVASRLNCLIPFLPLWPPRISLRETQKIRLDEVLGSKVGTEVHDLPSPEADEQPRGTDAEPLDTGVCALVGVAQLLLARPQVLHLAHNLGGGLFDASQLGLHGLELLGGLDGGPVLGVGANVDVELDGAEGWVGAAAWRRGRGELTSAELSFLPCI
jgi:hypothetical protein